jgi:hypothetical protein
VNGTGLGLRRRGAGASPGGQGAPSAPAPIDGTLLAAALGFAGAAAYTSAVAIREDLPGAPFGVRAPLSVPAGIALGWGAAVAAPWPMPAAAVLAALRRPGDGGRSWPTWVCAGVGLAGLVGILIEPNTYRPRSWTPATRRAVIAHTTSSAALAASGLRVLRRAGTVRSSTCS